LTQTHNHASIPPLSFLQAGCPSCCPTNSVKALKVEEEEWKYLDVNEHWQQMKNMLETDGTCGMSKGPCRVQT